MRHNLLRTALRAISRSHGVYLSKYLSQSTDEYGDLVKLYGEPKLLPRCSVQPVSTQSAQYLGWDITKQYITVYTAGQATDGYSGCSGDRITYLGHTYTVVTSTSWLAYDGWVKIVGVRD